MAMRDSIRSMALDGMTGAPGSMGGAMDIGAAEAGADMEAPVGGVDQIAQGIEMIRAGVEALPPDQAEKARQHLSALEEIVSGAQTALPPPGTPENAPGGETELPAAAGGGY